MNRNIFTGMTILILLMLAGLVVAQADVPLDERLFHNRPTDIALKEYLPPPLIVPDIEKIQRGNVSSRTWVVYEPDAYHMVKGHAFRIQEIGGDIKFVPLYWLRVDWSMDADTKIKLGYYQTDSPYYCATVDIPVENSNTHTTAHAMFIQANGPNGLTIEFDETTGTNPCLIKKNHGGSAHAEN